MKITTLTDLIQAKKVGENFIYPSKTKIMVGMATCGIATGAKATAEALNNVIKERQLDFSLTQTGCMGLCYKEPIINVFQPGKPRLIYHDMTAGKIPEFMDALTEGRVVKEWLIGKIDIEEDLVQNDTKNYTSDLNTLRDISNCKDIPFIRKQVRIATRNCGLIDPCSIYEYIARGGYLGLYKALKDLTPEEVIDEITRSGLRGRGGAGFPTGLKWNFARKSPGEIKYIICNADEGDPGAYMDRSILEGDPHTVLEGIIIGAYATGATEGYIYIRDEYPLAVRNLRIAIDQARECGLLGENIFNSGFDFVMRFDGGSYSHERKGFPKRIQRRSITFNEEIHDLSKSLQEARKKLDEIIKINPDVTETLEKTLANIGSASEDLAMVLTQDIPEEEISPEDLFDFSIQINRGAGAFVCGEETALIASIEGRVGEPRPRPPYPAQEGLWGKPTNINNVETWANVPVIIVRGAPWYSSFGTGKSKGTKVFSLVGKIKNTGLLEVPMGITLREIIYEIGGGILGDEKFKAIQTGGPSGGCLPEGLIDLPVDYEELTQVGAIMGSGGMIVMDEKTCMVDVAKYFVAFLEDESCGKCVPCREGTKRMHQILTRITQGRGKPGDIELLKEIGETLKNTALCALGGTAPNPVLSTLQYFKDEYETHIFEKRCPAGVCRELIQYYIDPEKCTGCGMCAKSCPESAVIGEKREPHQIRLEECIKCGACLEVCKFSAVGIQ
jgi:NADH:ubiquinone oxidoreductase subunit F (NADH-binding)/(2Fe-2S) ferredoxin/Pyruvate/2-oxoacid:ferredoxin oxidoreductase delta subunit